METEQTSTAVLALEDGATFYGRPLARWRRCALAARWIALPARLAHHRRSALTRRIVFNGRPHLPADRATTASPWISVARPWLSPCSYAVADEYSNRRAAESPNKIACTAGIPGLCELDTRALTRHLRTHGTRRGVIRAYPVNEAPDIAALVGEAQRVRTVTELDVVGEVAEGAHATEWPAPADPDAPRVLLIDAGYKHTIARQLAARGLRVVVAPHDITLPAVARLRPDGVLLSNGPGDPESVQHLVALTHALVWDLSLPFMGICLGHQLLGGTCVCLRHHITSRAEVHRAGDGHHCFRLTRRRRPRPAVSHLALPVGWRWEGLAQVVAASVQYHPEARPKTTARSSTALLH
jgi:carbamoyl-phosphate synthase small subunit